MTTFPIGLFTRCLGLPIRKALRVACEIGADGVVIDARNELRIGDFSQTSCRQFRKVLDDYGLQLAAISFPTRRGFDDPEDLDRRVLATREAMSFAYRLGAQVVLCRMDTLPELADEEDRPNSHASALIETLALLAIHGDRVGARLALASADDPARQAALFDRLPEGIIGVDLDPAALLSSGHDVEQAASLLGPHLVHVHANDAVREISSGAGARSIETPLGRGSVDLPALLSRLEEYDYHGWITAERNQGREPLGDLANAIAYLRSL